MYIFTLQWQEEAIEVLFIHFLRLIVFRHINQCLLPFYIFLRQTLEILAQKVQTLSDKSVYVSVT